MDVFMISQNKTMAQVLSIFTVDTSMQEQNVIVILILPENEGCAGHALQRCEFIVGITEYTLPTPSGDFMIDNWRSI